MAKRKIIANDDKLRELILLISKYSQADKKFGAIKLKRLLFYCDFSAYLNYGSPITGQQYFALPQGPAPKRLKPITERMKKNEELAYQHVPYHGYTQQRPIALRTANVKAFSPEEIQLIHRVLEKCWNKSATEISDESHLFLGWKVAREKEIIPYSTALVGRRPPTAEERDYGLTLQSLAEEFICAHR